jgi:hypothetical protein
MQDRYIYRTEKRDGIVKRSYVGKVDSVAAVEYLQSVQLRQRRKTQLQTEALLLDLLDDAIDDLDELERQAMRERGYEQNDSRKWRLCR